MYKLFNLINQLSEHKVFHSFNRNLKIKVVYRYSETSIVPYNEVSRGIKYFVV